MNRTPTKNYTGMLTPSKTRRPAGQLTPTSTAKRSDNKTPLPSPMHQPSAIKIKDKLFVLPQIQDIFQKLNFNSFQPFPFEQIQAGRVRLNGIYNSMKSSESPNCIIHKERLNLFCEKDKELVCVDCVYKDLKHKGHSIVPLDRVIKSLQFQAIRTQEKVQQVVDMLLEWEQKVARSVSDLSDAYLAISNSMSSIFKNMVNEIHRIENECSKVILLNFTRTSNIMKKYGQTIEKARGIFHTQLRYVSELQEVDRIGFLKEINSEVNVCEQLVKKTNDTIMALAIWKDVQTGLQRLDEKKKKDDETVRDRQVVVTEF